MIHHGNARPLRIVSLLTIAGLLLWACGGVGPTKTAAGGDEPSAAPPPALDPGTADQTTVKVTWTAPDTELVVTAYTVRWRSASDTEWTEVENNIQSTDGAYTISDLQPATEYEVQVLAVFETGDGAWSESVTVTTTEAASDPMSDPMTVAPPMVGNGNPRPDHGDNHLDRARDRLARDRPGHHRLHGALARALGHVRGRRRTSRAPRRPTPSAACSPAPSTRYRCVPCSGAGPARGRHRRPYRPSKGQ